MMDSNTTPPTRDLRHLSLKEKAVCYARLVREPGWELLAQAFRPEIPTRVSDRDSRERFLYEAVRAQVIREILEMPHLVMAQAARDVRHRPAQALNGPMPPIEPGDSPLEQR